MDLNLTGKKALVSGASKGIGLEVARHLAAEGCDVAITARGQEQLERAAAEVAAQTGRRILALPGDMGVTADVERCVARAFEEFGELDILVPCAGSSPGGLLEELTDEQWQESLNLKFLGYVRTVRAVIPRMRERGSGSIVLVVGNDGLKPSYWEMTAGAANAADLNFGSAIAEQYGRYGVRVNSVNPGPVETDRWDSLEKAYARDMGTDQSTARKAANASIPLGRITTPQEVAALVTFLASDVAASIHGAHIVIDGAQRKALMDR